jgi:hypothetical protein
MAPDISSYTLADADHRRLWLRLRTRSLIQTGNWEMICLYAALSLRNTLSPPT